MTEQPNPAAPPPGSDPAPSASGPASVSAGPSWAEPGLPAVEPAEETAPAQAVARDTGTVGERGGVSRSSGVRWAIALGGIAIVIGVTAAILALASGRPTPSIAVGYMPSDTLQYSEYRFDLPGDQRQKLAAFLSRFPGFADQAAIQPKLYEVFDRILSAVSNNSQTFTTDIQPWFGGQVAMGNGPIDAGAMSGLSAMGGPANSLVVVTITDPAKANAWVQKTIGSGAAASSYGGASLYLADGKAAAVTDKVLLGGAEAVVKTAIDSKGQGTLANDPEFKAAFATVSRDYVAFSFMDYRAYVTSLISTAAGAAGSVGLDSTTIDDQLLGLIPTWIASDVRLENDAIVADGAFPSVDIGYEAKNRAGTLAGHAPPGTLVYAESHDAGAALKAFIGKLRDLPELSPAFAQIDQAAGIVGGLDSLYGWWGDVAIAAGPNPDGSIGGGLLIAPTDAAAARRTFETLRSFVVLGGGQAGIKLTDEKHGDATVTTIDFSGALTAVGGVPPGAKAEMAYSVTDDVVVLGYGAAFVKAVLDAGPGPGLADDPRFKGLVGRAGGDNIGLVFVDAQGIRTLAEPLVKGLVPADNWATYEKEVVPYVSHLDAFVSAARVENGTNRTSTAFTVK